MPLKAAVGRYSFGVGDPGRPFRSSMVAEAVHLAPLSGRSSNSAAGTNARGARDVRPPPGCRKLLASRAGLSQRASLCLSVGTSATGSPVTRYVPLTGTTVGRTFPYPAYHRECVSQASEPRAWIGRTRRPSSAQCLRGSSCAGRPHLSPLPRTSRESGPRCSSVPRGPRK
jgi:hypothetical protein